MPQMNASRSPALATRIKSEDSNMMTGRTFWLYTTVTLAGGVAGGALMIQLATGGVAIAAKPAARTLTAQRLVLTDLDGRKRIVIGVAPDGAAKMAMYDNDGRERAEFGVAKDGG